MNAVEWVLASGSPRRQELLRELGRPFRVVVSDAEEIVSDQLTAREVATLNAIRKAWTVARKHPDALILAADTVVCLGTRLFGKPRDLPEALGMLMSLQGREHEVVTGVCLVHRRAGLERVFAETTRVTFHPLDEAAALRYLRSINPFDKAGGYAIQEGGEVIIREISGSYTNVVGLPMESLKEALRRW